MGNALPTIVNSGSINVLNFPQTQAVSGSVAVNSGSINILNLPAIQQVSGSVTVISNPNQVVSGSVSVINSNVAVNNFPTSQQISGSVSVTSGSVYVLNNSTSTSGSSTIVTAGSINVLNLPAIQQVSGSITVISNPSQVISGSVSLITSNVAVNNFPTTQAVSGSLTVTGGSININNFPASQQITGSCTVKSGSVSIVGGNIAVTSMTAGSITSMPTSGNAAQIQGTVAHDGVAANNPVLNGGYAVSAEPTAVSNADVARLITTLTGKLITQPYANPENFVSGSTSYIVDTTRTLVIPAQGSGVRTYITNIFITNGSANSTFVSIEDGTVTKYRGYAAGGGGGFSITLPVPLVGTANTAWNVSCLTTGGSVVANLSGYKGV
jgi:hypothetical protein